MIGSLVAVLLALTAFPLSAAVEETAANTAADAALYETGKSSFRKRCARCHGVNMVNPGVGVFDLRNFPKDEKARFVESVSYGKNAMPSWRDVLQPADIDALWSYVSAGATPPTP